MIALLDTNKDLHKMAAELGQDVAGQLLTPLTRFKRNTEYFAIDNGAFSKFDATRYFHILDREREHKEHCLFVALPDVVGSAKRTLELFHEFKSHPAILGYRRALVAQDGLENESIPWYLFDAIFIGGSTEWKMSSHAAHVINAAKILGKHVHVGRINTP